MSIRYDKLWILMKDNNQDRVVSMEVILRLCKVFHCDVGDIMEVIEDV